MLFNDIRPLLIAAASLVLFATQPLLAQENTPAEQHKEALDPGKLIFDHVMDSHEFHFGEVNGHPLAIPLPVIVYAPQKGFSCFMYSKFEHGHAIYNGYKLEEGKIKAANEDGTINEGVKVYDFSLTRNVTQMILSLLVFVWIMLSIAKKYKREGSKKAPSGFQNALEVVIVFIRDEVGKANLGAKYEKYMPYLLTVFFFILVNNLFGLIPMAANVTGNIAFTAVLGVISFLVITFSGNKTYWGHIFNPPVPAGVKPILVFVEFLSVFTKPFALIIRLFANMIAGHMIITCLVMLIFIFSSLSVAAGLGFSPITLLFTIFIYLIEILVAFIQAFIFANLTAVFIGQAIEEHHNEEHAVSH